MPAGLEEATGDRTLHEGIVLIDQQPWRGLHLLRTHGPVDTEHSQGLTGPVIRRAAVTIRELGALRAVATHALILINDDPVIATLAHQDAGPLRPSDHVGRARPNVLVLERIGESRQRRRIAFVGRD